MIRRSSADSFRREPVAIFSAAVAGYLAAIAAGWVPPEWVQWVAAAVTAAGGVLVRGKVTPTDK